MDTMESNLFRDIKEYIKLVSQAVAAAAITAPKVNPDFQPIIKLLSDEDINNIMSDLRGLKELGKNSKIEKRYQNFQGMIAIGAKIKNSNLGWDCGACGFPSCTELNKSRLNGNINTPGPSCNWISFDLGIACDYAAAMAYKLGIQW